MRTNQYKKRAITISEKVLFSIDLDWIKKSQLLPHSVSVLMQIVFISVLYAPFTHLLTAEWNVGPVVCFAIIVR